ncbi:MAG: NAD-dependent epimerase/dehydratase family protein [Methanoculleus sp.]|nr:NAD-dependent epimerase/dehydratase family protein [Methanoculleus sp. UBA413]
MDNLATGRRETIEHLLDHPRVTFIEGSITDLDLLMETFPGADGILAIPSVPRSVKNPLASNEANVTGTVSVLVAAKDCGVPAVVAASSSSVYGDTPGGPGPWLAPLDADGAVVVPGPAAGDLAVVRERWCRRRVWRRWDS